MMTIIVIARVKSSFTPKYPLLVTDQNPPTNTTVEGHSYDYIHTVIGLGLQSVRCYSTDLSPLYRSWLRRYTGRVQVISS